MEVKKMLILLQKMLLSHIWHLTAPDIPPKVGSGEQISAHVCMLIYIIVDEIHHLVPV